MIRRWVRKASCKNSGTATRMHMNNMNMNKLFFMNALLPSHESLGSDEDYTQV
jgi:hypothetical protein